MENLNYAFDVAEQHLDIPKMLDAEGQFAFAKYSYPCTVCHCCHVWHDRTSLSSAFLLIKKTTLPVICYLVSFQYPPFYLAMYSFFESHFYIHHFTGIKTSNEKMVNHCGSWNTFFFSKYSKRNN